MSDYAILFDSSRCSACKGCQVACKCWNGLPSPLGRDVNAFTGSYQAPLDLNGDTRLIVTFNEEAGGANSVKWSFGRRSCMHCANPACVQVCPAGALYVDEETGLTGVKEDKCVGCQYCASACPFDVPRYHGPKTIINKCTGCLDRISQGRTPACVNTCSPGALVYGEREELLAIAHERVDLLLSKGYEDACIYGEHELEGLGVITVAKYGLSSQGLPENPQVSDLIGLMNLIKPLTGLGMAALVGGLGLSFLTGLGYKRHEMHYDEVSHDIVDMDTGEVVRHIEDDDDPARPVRTAAGAGAKTEDASAEAAEVAPSGEEGKE